ncbi:MAG: PIN domain-containing protein, partial [Gemmataceae bacterium]|nr:PIN domain-containing protein [Gemmataceae bacterium]
MSRLVAVYDACVLYSASMRNYLMYLAKSRLFAAKWSADIHEEWMRSVERDFPDVTRDKLERTRRLMDQHIDRALVQGYEPLIPALVLPDPDDRHVLAVAIHAQASAIVTFNGKDFPPEALAPHGVEAITPDELSVRLISENEEMVLAAVREHRASLKKPPMTAEQYL